MGNVEHAMFSFVFFLFSQELLILGGTLSFDYPVNATVQPLPGLTKPVARRVHSPSADTLPSPSRGDFLLFSSPSLPLAFALSPCPEIP